MKRMRYDCEHSKFFASVIILLILFCVGAGQDIGMSYLFRQLETCKLNDVVLIHDGNVDFKTIDSVVDFFHSSSKYVVHYELGPPFRDSDSKLLNGLIWDLYKNHDLRDFLLVTNHPARVIRAAQEVFEKKHRGYGALMPHRIRFMLVMERREMLRVEKELENVIFDNVVLNFVDQISNLGNNRQLFTLMWRESGLRQFENVTHFQIEDSEDVNVCRIFPNLKHGMNGRHLIAIAKEWRPYLYKVPNQYGKLVYAGFLVDVTESLGQLLNFTFTLVPEPGLDENMSWDEFAQSVINMKVDFGASLYSSNLIELFNCSVTFPVLNNVMKGVYVNHDNGEDDHMFALYRREVYFVLLGSYMFTIVLYLSLSSLTGERDISVFAMDVKNNSTRRSAGPRTVSFPSKYRRRSLTWPISSEEEKVTRDGVNQSPTITALSDFDIRKYFKFPTKDMTNFDTQDVSGKYCSKTCCRLSRKLGHLRRRLRQPPCESKNKEEASSSKLDSVITVNCEEDQHRKNGENKQESKVDYENLRRGHSDSVNAISDYCPYILDIMFRFLGSLFNQGVLPTASRLSIRLLLWSWCLMVLVLNATFTGNLTADLIGNENSIPFSTFEEMIARKDYTWGYPKTSLFYQMWQSAEDGTTLKTLYEGMERFSEQDPDTTGSLQVQISKLEKGKDKHVAILDLLTLENSNILKRRPDVVVMKDSLMTKNVGLILPKYSQLELLFSENLLVLHSSGILSAFLNQPRGYDNDTTFPVSEEGKKKTVDLSYILFLLRICGYCLAMALIALVIEWVVGKAKWKIGCYFQYQSSK